MRAIYDDQKCISFGNGAADRSMANIMFSAFPGLWIWTMTHEIISRKQLHVDRYLTFDRCRAVD